METLDDAGEGARAPGSPPARSTRSATPTRRDRTSTGVSSSPRAPTTPPAPCWPPIVRANLQILGDELDDALATLEEARRLSRHLGDDALQAAALNVLGRLLDHQSRFAEAPRALRSALAIATARGDRRTEGGLVGNLGGPASCPRRARAGARRLRAGAGAGGARSATGDRKATAPAATSVSSTRSKARARKHARSSNWRSARRARWATRDSADISVDAQPRHPVRPQKGGSTEATRHLKDAVSGAIWPRRTGVPKGSFAAISPRRWRGKDCSTRRARRSRSRTAAAGRGRRPLELRASALSTAPRSSRAPGRQPPPKKRSRSPELIAQELRCGPESSLGRRLAAVNAALSPL